MSKNLQSLLDSVDQGMLIISPDGIVHFANQVAAQLVPLVVGKVLSPQGILSQIAAVSRGYIRLPLEFEIDSSAKKHKGDRLSLKLLESPLGGGYLLVIRNVSEATRYENVLTNFANLMTEEVQKPMAAFAAQLQQLLNSAVPDNEARYQLSAASREILAAGENIASQVTQLATFAQVFSKSSVMGSERIQILDLVSSLLIRLQPLLDERRLKVHMSGLNQELPVIYGSRDWLVEALYGYVEYLVLHCQLSSDLELIVRPQGNFVALQIQNHGRSLYQDANQQSFLPFAAAGKKAGVTGTLPSMGLGLPVCKRIVELHHGHLRLSDSDDDIASLLLELPAGAPAESIVPNLDAEQAQRYARDLMSLMKR